MVKIALPNPGDFTYAGGIKHFLRQLELCVHHAQKAYEEMIKDLPEDELEDLLGDMFVAYRFPEMQLYDREQDSEGYVKVHVDEETENMSNIDIEIH